MWQVVWTSGKVFMASRRAAQSLPSADCRSDPVAGQKAASIASSLSSRSLLGSFKSAFFTSSHPASPGQSRSAPHPSHLCTAQQTTAAQTAGTPVALHPFPLFLSAFLLLSDSSSPQPGG